jgi:undecaprenyl-diphosphatase
VDAGGFAVSIYPSLHNGRFEGTPGAIHVQNPTTRPAMAAAPRLPLPLTIAAFALLGLGLILTIPNDAEWWKVVLLGVVQGISEWLPISSTGHLLLTARLINFQGSIGGTFEIAIQFGTVLSVIAFYFADLLAQGKALLGRSDASSNRAAQRLWLAIIVAFIPAAVVGLLSRDFIKTVLFDSPTTIATALIIGGVVFLALELLPAREAPTADLDRVSVRQAIGIGIAQCFALIPGVSRSGASIVGGLLAGLDRRTATAFSFYLSIPILGAATLVDLLGSLDAIQADDWGRLLLGASVAMIVGYLCIGWLLRYVARHNFVAFGIYRIVIGVVILGLVAIGVLQG